MTSYTPRHLHQKPTQRRPWSRQAPLVGLVTAGILFFGATPAHAQTVREAQAPSQVTITRGDTLTGLARHWCGTAAAYKNLAAGNAIGNPDLILAGRQLRLTCTATVRPPSTTASRSNPVRTAPPASAWVNPLPGVRLSSCFGDGRGHKGTDFDGVMGQPVRAAASGTVTFTGRRGSGYGIEVAIAHGSIWSHYAHLSRVYVAAGQHVTVGQVIAAVGNSGDVVRGPHGDGSHLHFEVARSASIYGSQINPGPWLRAHGVALGGC